ncbi:tudor and KH domain-containing protein homolog isoform X2 [Leptidea sinapis]|uniref:tudor and KH domain-containing protein homolog isoform X2 n=1 Tax=Leptidea sinapis TaxID=189913 RepID=UPI0021294DDC|nr:tudor and KH domain-containing protein homolog isoform X2 [Leptidea sinapis]
MPLNTKLAVPLALGFSIVSVTAFVLYYIFKKEETTLDKSVKTSRSNVIEVSVPKANVAALIGRSGSNIKGIESKSGAQIHFKKFTDKDYDVCIIRGSKHATQLAETMIHDFIRQQPLLVTDCIEVPGWSVGRIIGHGGENINDISHMSGARVKVEAAAGGNNNEQRISFRGTKEQIEQAKKLIEKCVSLEKCRREVEQSKQPRRPQPLNVTSPPTTEPCSTPASNETLVTPGGTAVPRPVSPETEAAGSSIEVYVSAVSSPSRFWVQFVGPQVSQLDELVAHMTEYYSNKDTRAAHAVSRVAVGQVVAAVFRHDGRWYRARVDDIRPNEFDATQQVADVFYLDYGDSEYVATHELCELRADLLRLRFQAMECFLAGVKPVGDAGQEEDTGRWPKWQTQAVERFEELTQVARWKPLLSRTCSYKSRASPRGDADKEVPGIKLYDVSDEGSTDIGERLIAEGWALASNSPSNSPPRNTTSPNTPFGDLYNSRVLGMIGPRAASMPKDHKDERELSPVTPDTLRDNLTSISLSGGLESTDKIKSISNFDLSYDTTTPVNGSHDFVAAERQNIDNERANSPTLKPNRDEFKANMNRIDSHHSNLEALGRDK